MRPEHQKKSRLTLDQLLDGADPVTDRSGTLCVHISLSRTRGLIFTWSEWLTEVRVAAAREFGGAL